MTTRAEVIAAARSLVGTPWRHQGRQPGLALDCVGVLVAVAHRLGFPVADVTGYERTPDPSAFIGAFHTNLVPVEDLAAQPGDVLVFRDGIYPMHCGIVAGTADAPTLVHAYARRRMVVEERLEGEWLLKRIGAFAYPGIE